MQDCCCEGYKSWNDDKSVGVKSLLIGHLSLLVSKNTWTRLPQCIELNMYYICWAIGAYIRTIQCTDNIMRVTNVTIFLNFNTIFQNFRSAILIIAFGLLNCLLTCYFWIHWQRAFKIQNFHIKVHLGFDIFDAH